MSKEKKLNPLKKKALENIKLKKKTLDGWVNSGIPYIIDQKQRFVRDSDGEKVLDYYPTSLRSFYSWDGTQNSDATQKAIGSISGTGTTTLDAYPKLKLELEQTLSSLKSKAKLQLSKENKTSAIKLLKEELDLAEKQRKTSEIKYMAMVQGHQSMEKELRKERLAHQQSIKHLSDVIESKSTEINALQAQLSELRKTVDKIARIKPIR